MTQQKEPAAAIQPNYLALECPATKRLCPSRVIIDELCSHDEEVPDKYAEEVQQDSIKRTALLLSHTGLIKIYGCSGEVNNTCPPSVASSEVLMVRSAKRRIKKWLGR